MLSYKGKKSYRSRVSIPKTHLLNTFNPLYVFYFTFSEKKFCYFFSSCYRLFFLVFAFGSFLLMDYFYKVLYVVKASTSHFYLKNTKLHSVRVIVAFPCSYGIENTIAPFYATRHDIIAVLNFLTLTDLNLLKFSCSIRPQIV